MIDIQIYGKKDLNIVNGSVVPAYNIVGVFPRGELILPCTATLLAEVT